MTKMKEELGMRDIAGILGISVTSAKNLICNQRLRGWTAQPGREDGTFLSLLVRFIEENNFQRGPLLSFLEGDWAEHSDPTRFRITEPLGVGGLRFYSQRYHTLTTEQIADLSNVCARTAVNWIDKGLLAGYRLPISGDSDNSGNERRCSADNYLRFAERHNIPYEGQGLERKTTLLADYPGGWTDDDMLIPSLWYKQTKTSEQISVRVGKDGLLVLKQDDYISLILTGMTGRKGYGQVAHYCNHIDRINNFLDRGMESARTIKELDISGIIIDTLKKAQEVLHKHYEVTVELPQPKEKVLSPI